MVLRLAIQSQDQYTAPGRGKMEGQTSWPIQYQVFWSKRSLFSILQNILGEDHAKYTVVNLNIGLPSASLAMLPPASRSKLPSIR